MGLRIAHNPSFADPLTSHLELRLDQHDGFTTGGLRPIRHHQGTQGGQDQSQRDERHIGHRKRRPWIALLVELLCRQTPEIGAFAQHHPLIRAQTPGRLPIAHVDAIHPAGPVLEKAIGEATGGNSTIQADPVRHRDRERLQSTQQFLPAPRDETRWLLNPQFRGFRNLLPRLLQALTMDVTNLAGTNQLLGLLTR